MAVLVDAHAHFYPCFHMDTFLQSARSNFDRAARGLAPADSTSGVLVLVDPPAWDSLDALRARSRRAGCTWTIEDTSESVASRAVGPCGEVLTLIRGHQVPSAERLEVLTLAARGDLAAGAPVRDIVEQSLAQESVTILPWGFGKWLGRRGRQVASVIDGVVSDMLFVGDSGARARGSPTPPLIRRAAGKRIRNLPGTDPFPFPAHQTRAGSRGFFLEGDLDALTPARSFRTLLLGSDAQPRTFGSGMPPLLFTSSQLRMQIERRRVKGGA
jgi:hypothetical protein